MYISIVTRGVQIRSEFDPNPIGFVRISEQKCTYRNDEVVSRSVGSDFDIRNKMN